MMVFNILIQVVNDWSYRNSFWPLPLPLYPLFYLLFLAFLSHFCFLPFCCYFTLADCTATFVQSFFHYIPLPRRNLFFFQIITKTIMGELDFFRNNFWVFTSWSPRWAGLQLMLLFWKLRSISYKWGSSNEECLPMGDRDYWQNVFEKTFMNHQSRDGQKYEKRVVCWESVRWLCIGPTDGGHHPFAK